MTNHVYGEGHVEVRYLSDERPYLVVEVAEENGGITKIALPLDRTICKNLGHVLTQLADDFTEH